jgi:hypothetical protein
VMTEREYEERNAPPRTSTTTGRHAASGAEPATEPEAAWVLPRQSTEPWQRPQRQRGRHSA